MKLTEWFPAEVKPPMPGWYERNYFYYTVRQNAHMANDYWTGSEWMIGTPDGKIHDGAEQGLDWRGLAEKP